MDRRKFSKLVTFGGIGMSLGAATQTVMAAGDSTVSREGRKAWARETWKGFEDIVMASLRGDDLGELDEDGIRLDIRQSIAHGFFSSLIEASALSDAELMAFMDIAADEAGDELHLALTTGPRSEQEILPLLVQQYGLQWSGGWTVEALQSPSQPFAVTFFDNLMAGKVDDAMPLYWDHVQQGFNSMMKLMMPVAARGGHPWEMMKYFQFCTGGNGGLYRPDPSHPEVQGVTPEHMQQIRAHYEAIGVETTDLPDEAFAVGRINYES